jgi:homoaconitate hydratase
MSAMNLTEKLVKRALSKAGGAVRAGDFVAIKPNHVMTHDNTSPVMAKYKSIGAKSIGHIKQPVFTMDHNVQDKSEANLKKYASITAFAKEHGVDCFPAGRGIGHQVTLYTA